MTTYTDRQKACIDRPATQHVVKCWPEQFALLRAGVKRFEYRKNDRDYRAGDTLKVCEYDPNDDRFSGQTETFYVPHVLDAGFGLPEGYCVLSLESTSPITGFSEPAGAGDVRGLPNADEIMQLLTPREKTFVSPESVIAVLKLCNVDLAAPSQAAAPAEHWQASDKGLVSRIEPSTAAQGATDAKAHTMACDLQAEQTFLGSCYESCDDSGKARWKRLQRVIDYLAAPTPVVQGATLTDGQRDAINEAICWARDDGLPGTAEQLRSILSDPAHMVDSASARLREFQEWLNEHRDADVSAVFHDIVGKVRALLAPTPVADSADQPVAQLVQWLDFTNKPRFDIKVFDKTLKDGTKFYTRAAAKPVSVDAPTPSATAPAALTDEQIDSIWLYRKNIHNGELMPQLRDFARTLLATNPSDGASE